MIAAQRDVVYRDRTAALEHQDLHERMLEMIESEARRIVGNFTATNLPENWDLDGIVKHFESWNIAIPDEFFPENTNQLRRKQFTDDLVELALNAYEEKIAQLKAKAEEYQLPQSGDEVAGQFERAITLRVLDALWMDHIDAMDVMRTGIQLRGVAQKDPLVEFKREAFQAFDQLKATMQQEMVDLLYKLQLAIQVQQPAPQQALPRNMRTNVEQIAQASGQAKGPGVSQRKALPAPTNGRGNGGGQQSRPPTPLEAAVERASQGAPSSGNGAGARPAASAPASPAPQPAAAASGARPGGQPKPANGAKGQTQGRPNGQRPDQARHPAQSGKGQHNGNGGQRPTQPARVPQPAASGANAKIGRNDPCYCGSGKKYKMCHGR